MRTPFLISSAAALGAVPARQRWAGLLLQAAAFVAVALLSVTGARAQAIASAQGEEDDLYLTPTERRKATEAANQAALREAERFRQVQESRRNRGDERFGEDATTGLIAFLRTERCHA